MIFEETIKGGGLKKSQMYSLFFYVLLPIYEEFKDLYDF